MNQPDAPLVHLEVCEMSNQPHPREVRPPKHLPTHTQPATRATQATEDPQATREAWSGETEECMEEHSCLSESV